MDVGQCHLVWLAKPHVNIWETAPFMRHVGIHKRATKSLGYHQWSRVYNRYLRSFQRRPLAKPSLASPTSWRKQWPCKNPQVPPYSPPASCLCQRLGCCVSQHGSQYQYRRFQACKSNRDSLVGVRCCLGHERWRSHHGTESKCHTMPCSYCCPC